MKNKFSIVVVKMLASLIAILIVYISVSGFMSLIGGRAGIVVGSIFGIAELAFIIFFPSTLVKWPLMSKISKASVVMIVASLSLLSFASTTTYISKHMSLITEVADNNQNTVKIKEKNIADTLVNIKRDNAYVEKSKKELTYMNTSLISAEYALKSSAEDAKKVMYNKGRNCLKNKECAIRYDIASKVLASATNVVDEMKVDIRRKKKNIFDMSEKVRSQESSIDTRNTEIARINKNKVADNNAKKLHAGYALVGSKINDLLHIDNANPIQTFTTMIAVILYSLYIVLTIWLNSLLHISEEQILNHRNRRNKNNVFIRLMTFVRKYKNKNLEQKLVNAMKNSETIKKQLQKAIDELASVNELLTISKKRELILMRMAEPVIERVMVAVPENMSPSEAKKVQLKGQI